MRKFFSLIAAVLFAGSMMAAEVTITPENCGWSTTAGPQTGVVEGVTIATGQGVVGAVDNVAAIRTYKNQTLTISAESNITKIVITCVANGTAKYGPGNFTATGYTFEAEGPVGTWTGSAKSVALLASSAQVRATSIVVTLDGEGGGEGGEGETITLDVAYAEAAYVAKDGAWQFNLYKDYDSETKAVTYPDFYVGVYAKSATAIAGTYSAESEITFIEVDVAKGTTVEATSSSDLVVTHLGEGVYRYELTFVGDDENTYKLDVALATEAYDSETYATIELDEDGGEVVPPTPDDLATEGIHTLTPETESETSTEGDYKVVIDGIQLEWHGAYVKNDFRVFAGKDLTITAGANITKVEIAGKANKDGFTLTANHGTITTGASYEKVTEKADIEDPLIVVDEIGSPSVKLTCGKQLRAYTIRVTLDGEQGIEEILSEGKAVKVIREGNILIMKGDKVYNAMGQIVK